MKFQKSVKIKKQDISRDWKQKIDTIESLNTLSKDKKLVPNASKSGTHLTKKLVSFTSMKTF